MKQGLTEIITVHDESKAVENYATGALKAYKSFVASQKKLPGELRWSGAAFGDKYRVFMDNIPSEKIKVNIANFVPAGLSFMLDAVSKTMDDVGKRYAATDMAEHPENVIFIICVFDRDNASKSNTYEMVKEKIAHQRDIYNWKIFLMTNIAEIADKLGVDEEHTLFLDTKDKAMYSDAFKLLDEKITAIRIAE